MRRIVERLKQECAERALPPGPPLARGRANAAKLLGSFFGTGFLPMAPGTWGSLAALIIYVLALSFTRLEPAAFGSLGCLLLFLLFSMASLALGGDAQRAAAHKDPRWFVLDEMAGVFLALFALAPYNFLFAGLAFLLFRLFDALKIGVVGQVDRRLGGTVGILLDDWVAGAMANLLVRGLAWVMLTAGLVSRAP
jgi:phosphatidylglycerophosphatase A